MLDVAGPHQGFGYLRPAAGRRLGDACEPEVTLSHQAAGAREAPAWWHLDLM